MSKHNNVNPDRDKVRSRERPDNAVAKAAEQSAIVKGEARQRWLERERKPADKRRGPRKA